MDGVEEGDVWRRENTESENDIDYTSHLRKLEFETFGPGRTMLNNMMSGKSMRLDWTVFGGGVIGPLTIQV